MEIGEPKEGEIRVKNKAIGVNFIDVYFCQGVYQTELPFTPGAIPCDLMYETWKLICFLCVYLLR